MNQKDSNPARQPVAIQNNQYPKLVVRRRELAALLGISRSTTYLREKPSSPYYDPLFPKAMRLGGPRASGFLLADVFFYLEMLAKEHSTH